MDTFILEVVSLTNLERAQFDLSPLTLDLQLNQAAYNHSFDMAVNDFFGHTGSDGSLETHRVVDAGYPALMTAENIAAGYDTPTAVVQGWMSSAGHRTNLLNPDMENIGVGHYFLAHDAGSVNYGHYWTQVFSTRVPGTAPVNPVPNLVSEPISEPIQDLTEFPIESNQPSSSDHTDSDNADSNHSMGENHIPQDDALKTVLSGETLIGASESNILQAGPGNDLLVGGLGNDQLFGKAGDDVLRGDLNSRAAGGPIGGDDLLIGGAGNDRLGGKGGDDTLLGNEGDDQLWGDDGDDILRGGLGNDTLTGDDNSGGQGVDIFILAMDEGTDVITDFEIGTDFISLGEGLQFQALSFVDSTIRIGDDTLAVLETIDTGLLTVDSFI